MRKVLFALLALLLLLPLAALGALAIVGVERLRPWIESATASALDRPVVIEGPITLGWSVPPTLVVEGLRLGAQPGEREDLARIGRLELRPQLGSILRGELAVDRLALGDATVSLPASEGRSRGGTGQGTAASGREAVPALPVVREMRLERVRLQLPAGEGRPPLSLVIGELDGRLPDPEGPLTLEGRGELEGRPLALRLVLDSPAALLAHRKVRVEPLALELAGSDLEGVLDFDPGGPRPRLEGALTSRRLDLPPLAALFGGGPAPARGNGAASGDPPTAERAGGRLLPDRPIELGFVRGFEAALELRIGELVTGGPALREVVLPIRVGNGRLGAEPLAAELAGGRLSGRVELDAGHPQPALSLVLEGRGLATAELQRAFGQEPTLDARLDLDLELDGRGSSVRALVAALDGELTAALGEGRLRAVALDRVAGGVREAIRALSGQGRDGWVELRCGAFDLPIRAGTVELQVAVLETALARLTGEGRIDLASERLDLVLVPRSRGATLNLAVPVRVRGTFAAPQLGLDRHEAARRAALGLLGAFVFPPAALAAFADLGAEASPCLAAEPAPAERSPSLPGTDALKRALEGLFGSGR